MDHPTTVLAALRGEALLDADWQDAPLVEVLADDADGRLVDLRVVVSDLGDGSGGVRASRTAW